MCGAHRSAILRFSNPVSYPFVKQYIGRNSSWRLTSISRLYFLLPLLLEKKHDAYRDIYLYILFEEINVTIAMLSRISIISTHKQIMITAAAVNS